MSTYDVEDESILSTVFKDAFPESWRGNTEFAQYLSELSSYGVDKLNREPERLAEERSQILEQTQDLAFHNYKTFIQTAECSKEIFQDFQVIEKHVNSLLGKLPKAITECSQFLKQAQEINTSRRMNSMTLQRHTQLLEILEMPQLMDTCVRNGYYEEALELASHVKRLEKKHANLPVILNIVQEVKKSTQLMLNQLIHQLRSNIQLPACLRVIGYLRRMDVFTEAELRVKFLQARDTWFQGILAGIPSNDPYYHITKTIEASRVHLFDIITQYRAIFSDEDPIISPTKEHTTNEAALFHGWVIQKVSQFLSTLEHDLARGVGNRLDSLLGQCMYFGLSFSRVGADFRGLLAPIFQQAILTSFVQAVKEADARFDEMMQSFTLLGTLTSVPSSAVNLASQTGGSLHPPPALLEFSPLAVYCNNILTAFNDLRLCVPLSLASHIAQQVHGSLMNVSHCIVSYHRAEEATFNPQEAQKFTTFCRLFAEDLVPYLNKCLQVLFPPSGLATMLGIHVSELNKRGHVGCVNPEAVVAILEHLLPAKIEPEPVIESDPLSGSSTKEEDQSEPAKETDPDSSEQDKDTEATTDTPATEESDTKSSENPPTESETVTSEDIPLNTDQSDTGEDTEVTETHDDDSKIDTAVDDHEPKVDDEVDMVESEEKSPDAEPTNSASTEATEEEVDDKVES